ncbi:hypothetical protein [Chengkuizengella marina]|uniref:Uncharacterized protein n=1 Tax=Chengkuizengella marina TaxID=2507566 RepID=A0A6N9Q2D9_9BACL|nr:hypothetical protein [Chengkuizengella marina]NBI28328.1 hypothetical protein [Chengkuizengella marina]
MGVIDRTICDCCVCPMQCVMKQLITNQDPEAPIIFTPVSQTRVFINSVDNFIADTNMGFFPVCNVTAVSTILLSSSTLLKPVRNDVKGECKCCEDPATKQLTSLGIGAEVTIEFISGPGFFAIPLTGNILKVGEGIVILKNVVDSAGAQVNNIAISTCQITNINPSS